LAGVRQSFAELSRTFAECFLSQQKSDRHVFFDNFILKTFREKSRITTAFIAVRANFAEFKCNFGKYVVTKNARPVFYK